MKNPDNDLEKSKQYLKDAKRAFAERNNVPISRVRLDPNAHNMDEFYIIPINSLKPARRQVSRP